MYSTYVSAVIREFFDDGGIGQRVISSRGYFAANRNSTVNISSPKSAAQIFGEETALSSLDKRIEQRGVRIDTEFDVDNSSASGDTAYLWICIA